MAHSKKLLYFLFLTSSLGISCSGDKDPDPDQDPNPEDCKVRAYRCLSRNESWQIVYGVFGAIDSIKVGKYDMKNWSEIRTFSGNTIGDPIITINKYSKGVLFEITEVELGLFARINSIRDISPAIPPGVESWEKETFSYSSNSENALLISSVLTFSGWDDGYASVYEWQPVNPIGINMMKYTTGGGDYGYSYYLNEPTQPGDYLNFEKILSMYNTYSRPFSSTNLLKSISLNGDPVVEVVYTYDDNHRITSFSTTSEGSGDAEVWEVIYTCE